MVRGRSVCCCRAPFPITCRCLGPVGRSQGVRQRILIPRFGGSNPPAPASLFNKMGASSRTPLQTMSALYRHQGKDRQSRPRASQQLGAVAVCPRERVAKDWRGAAAPYPKPGEGSHRKLLSASGGRISQPARGDRDRVAPTAEANCRILIEADALDEAVDIGLARHATGEYRWGLFQCQRPTEPIGCRVGVRWRAQPLIRQLHQVASACSLPPRSEAGDGGRCVEIVGEIVESASNSRLER